MNALEYIKDDLDAEIIYILGLYREKKEFLTAANIAKFLKKEVVEIKKGWEKRSKWYDRTQQLQHRLKICDSNDFHYFGNEDTVRIRIKRFIEKGIVHQIGTVKTSGANGKILSLTQRGEFVFQFIEKMYPILDLIPNFGKNFDCNNCDSVRACLKLYERHLKKYLKEFYPNLRDFNGRQILGEIYSIGTLQELIFWLVMNYSANKILKMKYPILNACV
jgi:hypothetical protein